ncbi:hypothetical protein N7490_010767 [Penicillium lividum]|nr:hypothetical protein N7490_010767 [Penicillium lividum]
MSTGSTRQLGLAQIPLILKTANPGYSVQRKLSNTNPNSTSSIFGTKSSEQRRKNAFPVLNRTYISATDQAYKISSFQAFFCDI